MEKCIQNLRSQSPLIHCLTNYVTANDCANLLLACGASPIMGDAEEEVEEITQLSDGLLLNMGTPKNRTLPVMLKAGKRANELGHPVVFDPVGVGVSAFRRNIANGLMNGVHFQVIRGNLSEIKFLAGLCASFKGVDAGQEERLTSDKIEDLLPFLQSFAENRQAIIVVSGEVDLVCDGGKAYAIRAGHPLMAKVTGTGCMLSALITAYVTANSSHSLLATVAAVCAMGLAGEKAALRMSNQEGSNSFRCYLIDAISQMTPKDFVLGSETERLLSRIRI